MLESIVRLARDHYLPLGAAVRAACAALVAAQLAFCASSATAYAAESERNYAVVIQGAHLLRRNDDDAGYERVAYLPVGTIVELTGETRKIGVNGRPRAFSSVVSQSGVPGFLSDRLFQEITDRRIAVPVASSELPLFAQPYPETQIEDIVDLEGRVRCDERCIAFSRSNGVYLEITGDVDDYYEVALNRTLTSVEGGSDLDEREEKRWYLEKALVNLGKVKLVDGQMTKISMATWNAEGEPKISLNPEVVADLLEKIKGTGGIDIRESTIWCNSSIDATGQVKINLFFAEAGIAGGIATKKEGEFRSTAPYLWQKGDESSTYELHRDIECEHSEPANLLKLTLQEENGAKSIQIDSDRFKQKSCHEGAGNNCSDWIFLKGSGDAYDRMVIVNDWPSYNAILRQIEDAAGEPVSPEFVDYSDDPLEVQQIQQGIADRQNLYDFILRQIAIFKEPT